MRKVRAHFGRICRTHYAHPDEEQPPPSIPLDCKGETPLRNVLVLKQTRDLLSILRVNESTGWMNPVSNGMWMGSLHGSFIAVDTHIVLLQL